MTSRFKISVIIWAGALVMTLGQIASGQTIKEPVTRGCDQTMSTEAIREMVVAMTAEILNDKELRKQLIQEVTHAIGPDAMKTILRSNVGEISRTSSSLTPAASHDRPSNLDAALDKLIDKAVTSRTISHEVRPISDKKIADSVIKGHVSGNLVAVMTHPSNPINVLSEDQIRKLFTGEYNNWSQVGGPDLSVTVITVRGGHAILENALRAPLASQAAKYPFASFIIPAVAQREGAVGFLPTKNSEQLDFINRHTEIKKIAIDHQEPSIEALPSGYKRLSMDFR